MSCLETFINELHTILFLRPHTEIKYYLVLLEFITYKQIHFKIMIGNDKLSDVNSNNSRLC